jgi:hypothetical protein
MLGPFGLHVRPEWRVRNTILGLAYIDLDFRPRNFVLGSVLLGLCPALLGFGKKMDRYS